MSERDALAWLEGCMTEIRQIRAGTRGFPGYDAYERLLGALGSPRFGHVVRSAVLAHTAGARRVYLFEAVAPDRSTLHYCSVEATIAPLLASYTRRYQPIDPIGDIFRATPQPNDMALQRVTPDDISAAEFRRRFFDAPGIVERVAIIQRGESGWRGISVARHRSTGRCSEVELASLLDLAAVVLPMLCVHRAREFRDDAPDVQELEHRFERRYAALTQRERQVCARACAGMTIDATARELGIARTSVVTYRQRAYQRLGVSNTAMLRALVTH